MLRLLMSVVVANLMTAYYGVKMALGLLLYAVSHPLEQPWSPRRRLLPPEELKNPKYGTHKYLKVNNVKIHYVESGDSSKPLMVFLHGFPEFWYSWRHQIVHFNKDYWCVAIDMRGYGDSEKPDQCSAYHISQMTDDLRDLVRQLGRDKVIVVAHDWGGGVAWNYRERYPDTLLALVSISSSSLHAIRQLIRDDPEQRRRSWYMFFFRAWWIPELVMSFRDLNALDAMLRKGDKSKISDDDVECYKYTFGKPGAFTPPVNYYRANFSYTSPSKTKAQCQKPVPCLFASAELDDYLVPANADVVRSEFAHVETITLAGCGHFCPQEEPRKVNEAIGQFLQKHNL